MASRLANNFLEQLLKKEIDFDSDTFKIILMATGYTFNRITHVAYSDISASELTTANGYTAGGATLAGVVVSQDDTLNAGKVVWNNVVWTCATAPLVASGAIIYDDTTATKFVVGYLDFNGPQTASVGATFTITTPTVALTGA